LNGQPDVGLVEIDSDWAYLQGRSKWRDSTNTNEIVVSGPDTLLASHVLKWPSVIADDDIVSCNSICEMMNKIINLSLNTVKDTDAVVGDILRFDGISYKRMPKGLPNTVLQVLADGTDVFWGPGGTGIWSPTAAETVNNKTIPVDLNTIKHSTTNAAGDILKGDATKMQRFARGAQFTVLQATSGDLTYALVGDSNIATHTTTKISTTNKALLNNKIIYGDQNNNFGAFYNDFGQIAPPGAPASGFRRLFADNTNGGQLSIVTSAGATISLEAVAASSWNPSLAETLTNKTIDYANNTLLNVRTFATLRKTGHWSCSSPTTGDGIFNGFLNTGSGTYNNGKDTIYGIYQNIHTGSSSTNAASIQSSDSFATRGQSPTFYARVRIPTTGSCRIYVGWTDDVSSDPINSTYANSKNAALLMYGTSIGDGSQMYIAVNNNSSSANLVGTGITPTAGAIFTIKIKLDSVLGIVWSYNNGANNTISTQAPSTSTFLGLTFGVQTNTGSNRDLDVLGADVY
jgi:hypothetical protein